MKARYSIGEVPSERYTVGTREGVGLSLKSIYQVARETSFAELCRLLHQIFEFTAGGSQWWDKVLLEHLFELNEVLLARLQGEQALPIASLLGGCVPAEPSA